MSQAGAPDRGIAHRSTLAFAALIALIGWTTLAIDGSRVLAHALETGHPLPDALFRYFRYFTVLTNAGVAGLMTATALGIWRETAIPSAAVFRAALVYMAVTSAAYEVLLRRLWSPTGVQFWTDLAFHDVQPGLVLLFWLGMAPKANLRWRDLPWLLAYPTAYFIVVLVAGAKGGGYPYFFLNPTRLGYAAVVEIAGAFLAVFLALGAIATAAARAFMDDHSAAAWRRS